MFGVAIGSCVCECCISSWVYIVFVLYAFQINPVCLVTSDRGLFLVLCQTPQIQMTGGCRTRI